MTKALRFGAFILVAALVAVPGWASMHEEGDAKWHIHGDVRIGFEYTENYADLQDSSQSGDVNDDEFSFWPYRVRVALDGEFSDNVRGYVQLQNNGFFGNESPMKTLGGPIFQGFDSGDLDDTNLQQAFIEWGKIGGTSLSVRGGRQEHTHGTELQMGNDDFYGGLSFDGLRAWWNWEEFDLNAFYYKIDETNLTSPLPIPGPGAASVDLNFYGLTGGWKFSDTAGNLDAYWLGLNDQLVGDKVDTIGIRWGRMVKTADEASENGWDWNAELAFQTGDFGNPPTSLDISSTIFEGWLGYNFTHGGGSRSRVHVGALRASGDDNPNDADFEAYVPLFPDLYAYNRLGNTDFFALSNITDYNVGYGWYSAENTHKVKVAFHKFMLTEDGGGDDDLGTEIDVNYGFKYTKNTWLEVGVASLSVGNAFDAPGFSADDVLRVYSRVNLRW